MHSSVGEGGWSDCSALVVPPHCPLRYELQQQISAHCGCYTAHQGIDDILGAKFLSHRALGQMLSFSKCQHSRCRFVPSGVCLAAALAGWDTCEAVISKSVLLKPNSALC